MKDQTAIRTRDGAELMVTRYYPEASNHTVVIIAPAMGCRQEQYSSLASFLSRQGHAVYTYDYRGVGRSCKKTGNHKDISLYQWASLDMDAVVLSAKNRFPGHELAGLAHGVSGEIAGLAPASTFFSRLVLIDAALSSWALANRHGRFRFLLAYCFEGLCRMIPAASSFLCPNIPFGVLKEWLSWSKYANGLFHFHSNNNYQKIQAPVLSINFSQTPLANSRAVEALLRQFPNAPCSARYITVPAHHMKSGRHLRFYEERFETPLWKSLACWMQGMEAAVPESMNWPSSSLK